MIDWADFLEELKAVERGATPSLPDLVEDAIRGSAYEAKWRDGAPPDRSWALHRAITRVQDLVRRLGGVSTMLPPAPERPPLGVGWGTYRWKGHPDLPRLAVQYGASLIDTAPTYGRGPTLVEPRLGKSLPLDLGETWLATKFPRNYASAQPLLASVERSRVHLRRERIDLLQLHWPNPLVPLEETIGAMRKAQSKGWVRALGLCNVSVDILHRARLSAPISAVQVRFNSADELAGDALKEYCDRARIRLIAHSPLQQRGITAGLRRAVEFGFSPIPGTNSPDHLLENLR